MLALAAALAALATAAFAATAVAYNARAQALRSLRPCDRPDDLGWPHTATAFLQECAAWAAAIVLLPLGWTRRESVEPAPEAAVILIHDLGLNAGAFTVLRRRLRRSGWGTVITMRHPARLADPESIADQLHAIVEEITATHPRQIFLVGHGFGGLVARLYARRQRSPLVCRILTLGTAHQGSVLPRICGSASRALHPEGQLLSELRVGDRLPREVDVIALHSTFDARVLPPANAEYRGAFNIRLSDVGHNSLLFSSRVYELVAENLAAPLK